MNDTLRRRNRQVLVLSCYFSFFALFLLLPFKPLQAQVTSDFTSNAQSGCSPLTVQFTNLSSGPITSYLWDFGNGNTSNLPNPGVIYVTPGTYTVTLTVSDGSASDVMVKTGFITVFQDPAANFGASVTNGCAPLPVLFNDLTTLGNAPITSWVWDFGDGNVSNLPTPVHTYGAPGSYDVTLVVTDANGCTSSLLQPNLINVSTPPSVNYTWTGNTGCQIPFSVTFNSTVAPAGAYTYLWDFGDGATSSQSNPIHTYNTAGNYTIVLIATDPNGCADTLVDPNAIQLQFPVAGFFASNTNACTGEGVSFLNTSSGASSYIWDFGDGTVVTGPSPTHVYNSTGTYTVTLYASNSVGCSDTLVRTAYITVNPSPTALFSSTDPTGCGVPFVVDFNDLSSGNPVAWFWDFGDGNTATAQNPSHVYNAPGFYAVTLAVENSFGCTDTLVQPAYVQIVRPTADFVPDTVSGCIPLTVDFLDLSFSPNDTIVTWIWDFGDGGTSFQQSPSHVYSAVGQFTVSLVVITASGCRDTTVYQYIEAGIPPTVNFTANPVVVCAGTPVDFIDQSNLGTGWTWNFGDGGFSNLQNPSYTYSDTGTFDVTLITEYFGCRDTLTQPGLITVLGPIADFIFTPTTGCDTPLTVSFFDQSIAPDSWFWDFGDGATSNLQNPTHTYTTLGSYTITLVVGNVTTNCVDNATETLDIYSPAASFTAANTSGCTGLVVDFTNNSTSAANYFWDFGDGATSTSSDPSHAYSAPGVYDVMLIASNGSGCSDTMLLAGLVSVVGPDALFSVSNTTGCAPLAVAFTDLSTAVSGAIVGWQWSFGDGGTSSAPNPFYTYNQPGNYDVTLVVADNQGCADSLTIPSFVNPTYPSASFTSDDTLACPGSLVSFDNLSTGVGNTYLWDFGDGTTSTAINPVHVFPSTTGSYTVSLTVTDINGCVSNNIQTGFVSVGSPTAAFFAAPTQQNCPPLQVTFTDQSSANVTSWFWDFGDGTTSTLPNPSKIYSLPGTFDVTLVVGTTQGCSDTLVMADLIDLSGPGGSFTFTPIAGCSPLDVTFTASTGGAINWTWDFGDGNLGSGQTVTHTYANDTIAFPVLVIQDTAGCVVAIPSPDSVIVYGGPNPMANVDQTQICLGEILTFTDLSISANPIISYLWDFGDGDSAFVQNPQHIYTNPGNYAVNLTVTNSDGCTDSISIPINITVGTPPAANISPSANLGCAPLVVSFADSSTGPAIMTGWDWDFGDGTFSTQQNPSHTFTTPGVYTVKLVVSDANGCTDSTTRLMTVTGPPNVDFIVSSSNGCAPKTVQFNDLTTASVPIQSWFWDFGDGNTSTVQNPVHTYTFNGTFDVSLTVTDINNCVSIELKPGLIQLANPAGNFVSDATPSCPPAVVNFTATASSDTTITNWIWDFGDGAGANVQNPFHTYSTPGIYNVSLIITDAFGCSDTVIQPQHVTVETPPVASFSVSDSFFCAPQTVTILGSSTPGSGPIASYFYTFGNGATSNNANSTQLYSTPGSYTLSLVVSDINGCADTATKTIIANPGITADFGASSTTGCASTAITFLDQSTGTNPPVIWQWDFGDGTNGFTPFPTHVYGNTGVYNVSLYVEDQNGCSDSVVKPAFVNLTAPVADFLPDSANACPGQSISFTDASLPDTTLVAWLWNFGDGTTSAVQNPSHAYTSPGIYTVSLTITNAIGCQHTETKINAVQIWNPPAADFLMSDSVGCVPLTVQFTDTSMMGATNIIGFQWDFGNGNTFGFPNATQTYATPGGYPVSLIVTDAYGCKDTAARNLTVFGVPVPDFVSSSQAGCAPKSINFVSQTTGPTPVVNWLWNFGDGGTSFAEFPSHLYVANGTYDVSLTVVDANGCTDSLTKPLYIVLGDPPVSFSVDNPTPCTGVPVTFTDTSVPDTTVVSWLWNFGDGTTSNLPNPSHSYLTPGSYTVSLTTTNIEGCVGTDTLVNFIQVNTPPVAAFVASDTAGCSPLQVLFTDASSGSGVSINGWNWTLGNGSTSAFPNPIGTYLNPGNYNVQLIVSDLNGCTDTATQNIEVFVSPTANFVPLTTLACVNDPVDFLDLSGGPYPISNWLWNFGDGTLSTTQSPSHVFTTDSLFTVTLTVVDQNGCVDSMTLSDVVKVTAPEANFSLSHVQACPGTAVTFNDLSIPDTTIVSWLWTFGDGYTSTQPSPVHTYTDSGYYSVSLTVTNILGCSHTLNAVDTVRVLPSPEANFLSTFVKGCVPFVMGASSISIGNNTITQYQWYRDGILASQSQSAPFQFNVAGNYDISLVVTNENGCKDTASQIIEAFDKPVVDFLVSDTIGCSPEILIFTDLTNPAPPATWFWDFGDSTFSNTQNPIHTYEDDGYFTVKLTITDGNGCIDSMVKPQLIFLRTPEADFAADYIPNCPPLDATFTAVAVSPYGIASYYWDFGDGGNAYGNPVTYTYVDTGSYDVRLIVTDSVGCKKEVLKPDAVTVQGIDVPDPAEIHFISVENNESVRIVWAPVLDPRFDAYVVYRRDTVGGQYLPIHTTFSQYDTLLVDIGAGVLNTLEHSYCYKVVVRNYCGTESRLGFAQEHCTMEATATPIPDRIVVDWNNYIGWDQVDHYEIHRVASYNPNNTEFLDLVPGFVTAYIDSATSCFNEYTYRIKAVGVNPLEVSWSDTTQATNIKSEPSVATELVTATVLEDRYVQIEWKRFIMNDLTTVFLEKSIDAGQNWNTVASLPPTSTGYIDTAVIVHEEFYTYRLRARDSCGFVSPYSNIGTSILLTAGTNGIENELSWTPYDGWEKGVDFYEVQLFRHGTNTWVTVDIVPGDKTGYLDASTFEDIEEFCYRVIAHESAGNQAVSVSNTDCLPITPEIHAPNAFTPNADNTNDYFYLKGVYIREFHIKIYNRWGQQIFEAANIDDAWDGTFNGQAVPEGVYVFVAEATANNGRKFTKSGSVTLIR
ncbi:MAG: PKD domain-containing protein [Bacteroidia bacterium]|nr:PKD domain-containing protein [Bacteroidia bacterium]